MGAARASGISPPTTTPPGLPGARLQLPGSAVQRGRSGAAPDSPPKPRARIGPPQPAHGERAGSRPAPPPLCLCRPAPPRPRTGSQAPPPPGPFPPPGSLHRHHSLQPLRACAPRPHLLRLLALDHLGRLQKAQVSGLCRGSSGSVDLNELGNQLETLSKADLGTCSGPSCS